MFIIVNQHHFEKTENHYVKINRHNHIMDTFSQPLNYYVSCDTKLKRLCVPRVYQEFSLQITGAVPHNTNNHFVGTHNYNTSINCVGTCNHFVVLLSELHVHQGPPRTAQTTTVWAHRTTVWVI